MNLIFSTFLGGEWTDEPFALCSDRDGYLYITGNTISTDFPTSTSAFQKSKRGYFDVFVSKINPVGDSLIYSTYIGGSQDEISRSIKIDSSGCVYIAGGTGSANFPITAGAYQNNNIGGDNFITKLNANCSALLYSTFFGASNSDYPSAFTVDKEGFVYLAGRTYSLDFPITPTAYQQSFPIGCCGAEYITKLDLMIPSVNNDVDYPISEFKILQNYPNPFNPSTIIRWQAPSGGWQTLKVYDVLGNEVATLVDEYRNAGSYEVEFKSTIGSRQLANGVYFYQLKAGDFLETKKMILLK